MTASILIVDDEKNIRTSLSRSLSIEGYACDTAATAAEGRAAFEDNPYDLVMLDVQLPDGNGLDMLASFRATSDVPILVMSGHGTIEMALEAVRRGAHDFIEKPLATEKILIAIGHALRFVGQKRELQTLRKKVEGVYEILGDSPAITELRQTIAMAAPSKGRVLVTGESGTGKELIARACHQQSNRASNPFIKLNCAAIPGELIESELFGHERGAFTGAHKARKGKFELADGGTLFLDEIGDMRMDVQAKLLRALQEGEIERVGGSRTIRVDVRVVSATNKDLESAIADGEFREDLFYRLNVIPIHAPPLRARKSDLAILVPAFIERLCDENGMKQKRVDAEALEHLKKHDWPGNVRELHNACERLVILTRGDRIAVADTRRLLGEGRSVGGGVFRPNTPMRELVADAEREIISAALAANDGHVTQTAASLSLERSHLYKKMRALGMQRD